MSQGNEYEQTFADWLKLQESYKDWLDVYEGSTEVLQALAGGYGYGYGYSCDSPELITFRPKEDIGLNGTAVGSSPKFACIDDSPDSPNTSDYWQFIESSSGFVIGDQFGSDGITSWPVSAMLRIYVQASSSVKISQCQVQDGTGLKGIAWQDYPDGDVTLSSSGALYEIPLIVDPDPLPIDEDFESIRFSIRFESASPATIRIYAAEVVMGFCECSEPVTLRPEADLSLTGGTVQTDPVDTPRWQILDHDLGSASGRQVLYELADSGTITDTLRAGSLDQWPLTVTFRIEAVAYGYLTSLENIQLLSNDDVIIAEQDGSFLMPDEDFVDGTFELIVNPEEEADLSASKIRFSQTSDYNIYTTVFTVQMVVGLPCDSEPPTEPCEPNTIELKPSSDISVSGGEIYAVPWSNRWECLADGEPDDTSGMDGSQVYYSGGPEINETLGAGALSAWPSSVTFRYSVFSYNFDTTFNNVQLLSNDNVVIAEQSSTVSTFDIEVLTNGTLALTVNTPTTADLSSTKIKFTVYDPFYVSVALSAVDMVVVVECPEEESDTYNETMSGGILGGGTALISLRINQLVSGGCRIGGSSSVTGSSSAPVSGGLRAAGSSTISLQSTFQPSGGVLVAGSAVVAEIGTTACRIALTVASGSVGEDLQKFVMAVSIQLEDPETVIVESFEVVDAVGNKLAHQLRVLADGLIHLSFKADVKADLDNVFFLQFVREIE